MLLEHMGAGSNQSQYVNRFVDGNSDRGKQGVEQSSLNQIVLLPMH